MSFKHMGRRLVLLAAVLAISACTLWPFGKTAETDPSPFVTVSGVQFELEGAPYAYVGANFWYGAYLGADGETGDIDRLRAELDQLKSLGVTNLRVLGASELSPMKNSLKPAFRNASDDYNEDLLRGLDVLLAEMGQRDMKAVIYLNNFWEWSGGMGTYLSWVNGGDYIDLGDPAHPWPAFPLFNMQFYGNADANALYRDYIHAVVTRTNTVTGLRYAEDPAIMAWQLANEPRPGHSPEPGMHALPEFYEWVDSTARYIKSLDANHLVSTGNEGTFGCAEHVQCFVTAHTSDAIDYLTFHMWPKNWSWLDDQDMAGTFDRTLTNADAYIDEHLALARQIGKPIVLEEFGLPRDGGAIAPETATTYRDRFYAHVFAQVEDSVSAGGPFAGTNFWTWGGAGRAQHDDGQWQTGDTSYTGDPPQEAQGLNSVFDTDASTLAVLQAHAGQLDALSTR